MNRRITVDLPVWQVAVAAGSAIICATTIGAGLVWGGLEYGRATAPTPAPTERVYTTEDLQGALTGCGIEGVQVPADGTVLLDDASYAGLHRECVLIWLEAPGPVIATFEKLDTATGETKQFDWSNVHVSWVQKAKGRDLTITIQEA